MLLGEGTLSADLMLVGSGELQLHDVCQTTSQSVCVLRGTGGARTVFLLFPLSALPDRKSFERDVGIGNTSRRAACLRETPETRRKNVSYAAISAAGGVSGLCASLSCVRREAASPLI